MKIVLELGIAPVTVKNTVVIRAYYFQLWNNFILPEGIEELTNLIDTGELQMSEPELASLLEDSRLTNSAAEKLLLLFSETVFCRTEPSPILSGSAL